MIKFVGFSVCASSLAFLYSQIYFYHLSIIYVSVCLSAYHWSIIHLVSIIYHLSSVIWYLLSIYRLSIIYLFIIHLSSIYHLSSMYPSISLSFIYLLSTYLSSVYLSTYHLSPITYLPIWAGAFIATAQEKVETGTNVSVYLEVPLGLCPVEDELAVCASRHSKSVSLEFWQIPARHVS